MVEVIDAAASLDALASRFAARRGATSEHAIDGDNDPDVLADAASDLLATDDPALVVPDDVDDDVRRVDADLDEE